MTKQEFYDKFGLKFKNIIDEFSFLNGMDKLYLEYTEAQACEIVKVFYENADDIYNDAKKCADEYIQETIDKLKEFFEDAEEENVDKPIEA